jgi:DNA-binding protein H-NS
MLPFDLDRLTMLELVGLEERIKAALGSNRQRETVVFKAQMDAVMAQFGMSLADVAAIYGFKVGRRSRKGVKVPVKYRNPNNPNETWTGRGRQPRWLVALLTMGHRLEEFLVAPHGAAR